MPAAQWQFDIQIQDTVQVTLSRIRSTHTIVGVGAPLLVAECTSWNRDRPLCKSDRYLTCVLIPNLSLRHTRRSALSPGPGGCRAQAADTRPGPELCLVGAWGLCGSPPPVRRDPAGPTRRPRRTGGAAGFALPEADSSMSQEAETAVWNHFQYSIPI